MIYAVCCFRCPSHSARLKSKEIKGRIEAVIAQLRESVRTQLMGSLGVCLLLLADPGRLAAQESASRLFPGSADSGWPAASGTASLTRPFPVYRMLPEESPDHEPLMASADLGTNAPLRFGLGPRRLTRLRPK